jgi:hypothetical protein
VVSFTPLSLYREGKRPRYPFDRRLGRLQSRFGRSGVEKNSQPLSGIEPPIIQLVAQRYTTELSRLLTKLRGISESQDHHIKEKKQLQDM